MLCLLSWESKKVGDDPELDRAKDPAFTRKFLARVALSMLNFTALLNATAFVKWNLT